MIGSQSFYSLDRAVSSLTNNATIRITGPNMLKSNATVRHLDNVAIIGNGISTVDCVNIGAIHFISCNNVSITGVNWERCGSNNELSYPGISFYKSSNVTIQNCSFNYSLTQAIVFSQVSGDIYINNSVFTYNTQHKVTVQQSSIHLRVQLIHKQSW